MPLARVAVTIKKSKHMKTSNYQQAKRELKSFHKEIKKELKDDKPALRQSLNDYANTLLSDYNLSEYQTILLQNFVCTLHP